MQILEAWAMGRKRAAQKVAEHVEEVDVLQDQVVQKVVVVEVFQVIKFVMLAAQRHLVYSKVMRPNFSTFYLIFL